MHHIKQNVAMRYGKPGTEFVFPLAKSYYTIREEEYFEKYFMSATTNQLSLYEKYLCRNGAVLNGYKIKSCPRNLEYYFKHK